MEQKMYSVATFCDAHAIGRSLFYDLLKTGNGPRITKLGRRTLITNEAAREWREKMEKGNS